MKQRRQLVCKVLDLRSLHEEATHAAAEQLQRCLREVDILAKVKHVGEHPGSSVSVILILQPGLLVFEYAFRSKHTMYIFTELASGGDLFSKLITSEPLGESEVKFIIHQILRGISYLHNHLSLAHRDIKPENIFFASGPKLETRVILGDFGHAKATTWGRLMSSNLGTNSYQAP